jgi:putative copper resistance protein D
MLDSLVNFVHLLATAVWLGGAIFIKAILEPAIKTIDPREAGKLQSSIAKRFTITAWTSIILLIITGIMKTPPGMWFDLSSDVGTILTIKHILILVVLVIGLIIGLVAVPRLQRSAPAPGSAPSDDFLKANKSLLRLSLISTITGVLIVFCASFLW